jgi:hypothetical protein
MVLNSFEVLNAKPGSVRSSGIIDQLLGAAKDTMAGGKPKTKGGIPQVVIDEEVDRKIRQLKIYEDLGDLCWMDTDAWRSLPKPVQRAFTRHLDPLPWAGAYFQQTRFRAEIDLIFDRLDPEIAIYELADRGNYRLIVMSAKGDAFSSLGTLRFRAAKMAISQRVVRAYARTASRVVVREFGA